MTWRRIAFLTLFGVTASLGLLRLLSGRVIIAAWIILALLAFLDLVYALLESFRMAVGIDNYQEEIFYDKLVDSVSFGAITDMVLLMLVAGFLLLELSPIWAILASVVLIFIAYMLPKKEIDFEEAYKKKEIK